MNIWARLPVGRMIAGRMDQRGMTRHDLVSALGYSNLTKGLRRVDAVLRGEEQSGEIFDRVCAILGIERDEIDVAIAETRNKQIRERIDSIIPKLRIS